MKTRFAVSTALVLGTFVAFGAAIQLGAGSAHAADTAPAPALVAAGKTAFAECGICHSAQKGVNSLGPSLYGVVGRPVASAPGFTYSPAMQKKGGAWTDAAINALITDPRGAVPGTRMTFAGEKDAAKRTAIIAYLKTLK